MRWYDGPGAHICKFVQLRFVSWLVRMHYRSIRCRKWSYLHSAGAPLLGLDARQAWSREWNRSRRCRFVESIHEQYSSW